jgi:signal transduction histidine kinase
MTALEDLVDRLAAHRLVGSAPRSQLVWLAAHGQLRRLEAGESVLSQGAEMYGLYVVFSGRISVYSDRGGGKRKVMEWTGGDITGLLPFSRATTPPGPTVAEEPTEALLLLRERFPDLIRECYELTSIFVHVMLDRTRHFTSSELHDKKMQSLGNLAAGLAHELNNPASAVARSASALPSSLTVAVSSARALGAAGLKESQLAAVDRFCAAYHIDTAKRHTAIDKADREDDIAGWLSDHGLHDDHAESLADSSISIEQLDQLAAALEPQTLETAVRYVTANYATRTLTSEIERASSRISNLVAAVKRFTYLDQASVPKPVNVRQDLDDTLVMLTAKAKKKSATVTLDIDGDLPPIQGFGGELNQVWANLVDNALDAVPAGGHVTVTATHKNDSIVVRIIDNGSGVPKEIQDRIFDPFFTTKAVGEGTGLGLGIVRRILQRHSGQIEVTSQPGRTEFVVTLPINITLRHADTPGSSLNGVGE